jgi:hypothetical protein
MIYQGYNRVKKKKKKKNWMLMLTKKTGYLSATELVDDELDDDARNGTDAEIDQGPSLEI